MCQGRSLDASCPPASGVRRRRLAPIRAGSFSILESRSWTTAIRDPSRARAGLSRLRACGVRACRQRTGGWTRYVDFRFSIFDFDDRQGQVVADGGVLGGRLRCTIVYRVSYVSIHGSTGHGSRVTHGGEACSGSAIDRPVRACPGGERGDRESNRIESKRAANQCRCRCYSFAPR